MDFLKEFEQLRLTSPHPHLRVTNSENCEFNNYCDFSRNCYMTFGAARNEDCYYGITVINCRDCIDVHTVRDCELCYECMDCENCYSSEWLQDCKQVRDSTLCFDCVGCEDCFGCVSQRNKKYMMFNETLSKEEYEKRLKFCKTPEGLREGKKRFEDLLLRTPRVYSRQTNCEDVTGDYLVNSQRSVACYDAKEAQDCLYCDRPIITKDNVDCSNLFQNCELDYMVMSSIQSTNCNYCFQIDFSHDCEYCMFVYNSHHMFGCVARNHGEYEILNQKYEPDEWFKRVAEIKDQMRREGTYEKMFESDFPLEDTIVKDYLRS